METNLPSFVAWEYLVYPLIFLGVLSLFVVQRRLRNLGGKGRDAIRKRTLPSSVPVFQKGALPLSEELDPSTLLYMVKNPLFFSSPASLQFVLDCATSRHDAIIIDLSMLDWIDDDNMRMIRRLAEKTADRGIQLRVYGLEEVENWQKR